MTVATRSIEVVDDVADAGARLLLDAVSAGGNIALAGGGAAMASYRAARGFADVDWSGARLWFSDERVVPVEDERSNAGQAQVALLDAVRPRAVELVRTDLGPVRAAEEYEARIRGTVAAGSDGTPRFDLVLLGLGPDGHTASLPPGGAALAARDRLVVEVSDPSLPPRVDRVSFTLPLINASAGVVFLVAGAELAPAARRAFAQLPSNAVPASLVAPASGRLRVIIDAAAAVELDD